MDLYDKVYIGTLTCPYNRGVYILMVLEDFLGFKGFIVFQFYDKLSLTPVQLFDGAVTITAEDEHIIIEVFQSIITDVYERS